MFLQKFEESAEFALVAEKISNRHIHQHKWLVDDVHYTILHGNVRQRQSTENFSSLMGGIIFDSIRLDKVNLFGGETRRPIDEAKFDIDSSCYRAIELE